MPASFNVESFLECLAPIWSPHAGQREFLLNPAKIKVLACGRRWGKTDACAASIVAALSRESPTRHVILAPTLDQARLLFDRSLDLLERAHKEAAVRDAGKAVREPQVRRSPYPKLAYGAHTVIARSGHLGRALRGNEATHIVIDEASYVPEELITEVAMPMLATTEGYLTMIGTPHGLNHFWRFFRMGQTGEHGVWSRRAPSSESPYVSREYLDVQRELISERAFRVEYEAEFLDCEGRVFRTEAVEGCVVPRLPNPPAPPFFIGVDWARYTDFTAVAVVCGTRRQAQLVEVERFHGISWAEQVARVARQIERFPSARVLCDATGSGDPLLEMLQGVVSGASVKGLRFTSGSKAELVDGLAWLIENRSLAMEPYPELLRELEHFESRPTPAGNRKLEARGGYHDDLVIALALACHGLPRGRPTRPQLGPPRRFSRFPSRIRARRFSRDV